MKQVILDFIQFETKEEVHEFLSQTLGFPEYYGRNLDALYDLLSVWSEETAFYLFTCGKEMERGFSAVIRDAAQENRRLRVFESRLP